MNANEISPKLEDRLHKIEIVSRIAKWTVLAFFLFAVCFSLFSILSSPFHFALRGVLSVIYQIVLCVWYWKLAQLFRFYEQGQIFAAKTINCIKILGVLCAIGGILMSLSRVLTRQIGISNPFPPTPLPPGVVVTKVEVYRMGFFSFDFGTGVDFGLVLTGIAIVLVAWIMDEGRKIQEEQELTV